MQRANPATQRKALEFANELAKHGVPMVIIPLLNDRQRARLTNELAHALAEFEALGAAGEFESHINGEQLIDSFVRSLNENDS